jgi:3-oxoacyl-[acyl-carrier-protein] synthase II
MKKPPVYITGKGMVTALGIGSSQVWKGIVDQKDARSTRSYTLIDGQTFEYPVYTSPEIRIEDWVDSELVSWLKESGLATDQDFMFLLAAAKQAFLEANFISNDSHRTALVVGHENIGVNRLIDRILTTPDFVGNKEIFNQNMISSYQTFEREFFHLQTFPHLFYLSKCLGIGGQTYIVNNACATGLYAIDLGRMLIETKQADAVLVVCSDYAHPTEHLWLKEKQFCSMSSTLRPFDGQRDGSVLGDGAGAVLLESSSHLQKRDKAPLYEYQGGDFRQDHWRIAAPDVTKHTYSKVMYEAMNKNRVESIDLLIPHGAGIPLWDLFEAKEIEKVFNYTKSIPTLTACKGYIGHTLGANSIIESIIGMLCMEHNLIPPVMHYENKDPKIDLEVNGTFVEKEVTTFMKSVCAYGGFNAASIFKKIS